MSTKKSAIAALAASNDLLLDELDRQQESYSKKLSKLQKSFTLRAPTEAELAQIDDIFKELDKIRLRKQEIVLLEFAALDSSDEVTELIGRVGEIKKRLKKEKQEVEGVVEKVQNIERLIKHVDAIAKNLLTIATLFA